jgi:hypothetical protein
MALGADRGRVALRTFLEGMAPVTVGIATGLLLALGGARMMAGLLYGVTATDPVTLVVAPALMAAIGATSLALPAHRARRTEPDRSHREQSNPGSAGPGVRGHAELRRSAQGLDYNNDLATPAPRTCGPADLRTHGPTDPCQALLTQDSNPSADAC